jgi:hypothetical protein
MAIDTNQQKIDELLSRGVENIYPSKEFLEKELKSGRQLVLYTGYDPTAPTAEPAAEMSDNSFHEISFLYASTTRRKASGRIGEMVASSTATINVTDLRCFVFESELIV